METSHRGIGTAAKVAAVVVVLLVAGGVIYADPGLVQGSPPASGPVVNLGAGSASPMYSLIQEFPKMTVSVQQNDVANQFSQDITVVYTVIGKGTINGTQYTKVEFVTVGQQHDVTVWYSPTGQVGEVDVPGVRNYAGNGTGNLPYVTTYTAYFGAFVEVTNNATLLSHLVWSTGGAATVGGLKAQVATYVLGAPTPELKGVIVKYATFSGINLKLAYYIYELTPDGSTETIQITSLTR
ncbi:MAG: hypothetical protein JRN23_01115 [Nitrososphaerota archaeon]|nr:hypothetical protein [Nitrososphaerota archaeon]MDG6978215.1 hypothetical protein [Nitrososphaerota archaeon]MDG7020512.1 hypothetical protein [Nitrososphaerota archaeon]MDG7021953.1 hypothetical protein [Nitrososphaerota archaeon]